jgi:hypothetical protein
MTANIVLPRYWIIEVRTPTTGWATIAGDYECRQEAEAQAESLRRHLAKLLKGESEVRVRFIGPSC